MEENQLAKRQPLTFKQYQSALIGIDWTSPDPTAALNEAMYKSSKTYGAEPIYLGQDNTYLYYLQPEMLFLQTQNDLNTRAREHPSVLEMRSVDGTTPPPFTYSYCLGTLYYRWDKAPTSTPLKLNVTPFHIYLDVVSLAIWMVFDINFKDELGEEVPLAKSSNAWESLPSPQNGRDLFKALKLMGEGDLSKIDQQRSFFSSNVMATAFKEYLQPWVVDRDAVKKAVADGIAGTSRLGG